MTETVEELEAEIRKISSEIFALHEKRNTDWRKLSNEEKQGKNAYMTERLTHSIEWQKLTASIMTPVFNYAKIKFQKYQKKHSYSEKLMKTLQDCLLGFDKDKNTDFIHYLNRSLKRMFSSECEKDKLNDKLGGMSHIDKERTDKTIAGQGKNLSAENVKGWMNQYVLRDNYKIHDEKEKSLFEGTADDSLNSHTSELAEMKEVKSIIFNEIDKEDLPEAKKAIITHYFTKIGFTKIDFDGYKFFSVAEYEALCKNPQRSQKEVMRDYGMSKGAYNKILDRLNEKLRNRKLIKELKKAEVNEEDDKSG